jgi:hypothetical protein
MPSDLVAVFLSREQIGALEAASWKVGENFHNRDNLHTAMDALRAGLISEGDDTDGA